MRRFRPSSPDDLAAALADLLLERHGGEHALRVAFDAPRCVDTDGVVQSVTDRLARAGRPSAVVRAADFYRDASLRFEFGKTDVESFYTGWLDSAALEREVLRAVSEQAHYLPSLRDPQTNRSTRSRPISLAANGVLIVVGELLLGAGLSFDVTVHFDMSRQARKRRMPDEWQWTLHAFDRYELDVDPAAWADVVVRCDDPRHPALAIG